VRSQAEPPGRIKPGFGLIVFLALGASALLSVRPWQHEEVPWRGSLESAEAEAAQRHNVVFVAFDASWCEPCRKLDHFVFTDPTVGNALAGLTPVKLDYDRQGNHRLFEELGGIGLPAYFLLRPDGSVVARGGGAVSPQEFLAWLRDALRAVS
jgi:thiol:disulfide interchange protein